MFLKNYFSIFLLAFFWALSAETPESDASALSSLSDGVDYEAIFPKDLPKEVSTKFEGVSSLIIHKKRLPGSLGGLIKRAETDKILFEKVLRSLGYYSAKVKMSIDSKRTPVAITFAVFLGARYTLAAVTLESLEKGSAAERAAPSLPNFKIGEALTAEEAIAAKLALEKYFSREGYPFIEIGNPEAEINHAKKNFKLIYPVRFGGKGVITGSIVKSLPGAVEIEFIRNRSLWKNGDVYDTRTVEKTRGFLTKTGLFDSIDVKAKRANPKDENADTGFNTEIPIIMELNATEAPPRSITAGARYDTTQGAEAVASWNHYNLAGHGENLGVSARASGVRGKIRLHYDVPDFWVPLQTLRNETFFMKENTRAYRGRVYEISSKLERQLTEALAVSLGVGFETGYARPKTDNAKVSIKLISVPLELRLDTSNDLLNPTRGMRVNGAVTPYAGKLGSSKGLVIARGGGSAYLPFATDALGEDFGTLAAYAKIGEIFIRNFSELPPNKRFYGGGSGSIRGYGFQKVGPFDGSGIPTGGQSLFEAGAELRYRFTATMGGALFFEGGNVWAKRVPDFKKNLLYGAGFGFRYYTTYAPIRVDLAFPLKRRKIPGENRYYDAAYQFYVSVGQAF